LRRRCATASSRASPEALDALLCVERDDVVEREPVERELLERPPRDEEELRLEAEDAPDVERFDDEDEPELDRLDVEDEPELERLDPAPAPDLEPLLLA
jgi:hypothetical protein